MERRRSKRSHSPDEATIHLANAHGFDRLSHATCRIWPPFPPCSACPHRPHRPPYFCPALCRELWRKRKSILSAASRPLGYSASYPLHCGTVVRNSQFYIVMGISTIYQAPSPTASGMNRLARDSLGQVVRPVGNAHLCGRPQIDASRQSHTVARLKSLGWPDTAVAGYTYISVNWIKCLPGS